MCSGSLDAPPAPRAAGAPAAARDGAPPGFAARPALRTPWLLAAGLVLAVALTFANAVPNAFVFDDHGVIVRNLAVRAPLGELWGLVSYRPLRALSYRLDYAIGGMRPAVFHLSNLVHHVAAVLLVFAAVRACGATLTGAAVGALVFAVHPVQADTVTYAAGRRDELCGLFFVAGFLAWTRYRAGGGGRALALAGAALVFALLAKEMAVTLPLVCLLYDRRLRRQAGGAAAQRQAGDVDAERPRGGTLHAPRPRDRWWLALAAVAALAVVAHGDYVLDRWRAVPWHGGGAGANFATVARIWAHYLTLLVWPARLSADYSYDGFPVSAHALDPRALASVAVLAVLGLAAWRSWRAGGLPGLGAAWWALTLVPVSHLVPHHELLAEHYLYVPMVGVALAVAGGWDGLAARAPAGRRVLATAVLAAIAILAARTIVRNRDWRDELSLWSATVAVTPRSARARVSLGHALRTQGRLDDAEREWQVALAIRPEYAPVRTALAMLYAGQGRLDLAAEHAEAALRLMHRRSDALLLAGEIALARGDAARAEAYFEEAVPKLAWRGPAEVAYARARAARARAAHEARTNARLPNPAGLL